MNFDLLDIMAQSVSEALGPLADRELLEHVIKALEDDEPIYWRVFNDAYQNNIKRIETATTKALEFVGHNEPSAVEEWWYIMDGGHARFCIETLHVHPITLKKIPKLVAAIAEGEITTDELMRQLMQGTLADQMEDELAFQRAMAHLDREMDNYLPF